jgi:hypothetical protein
LFACYALSFIVWILVLLIIQLSLFDVLPFSSLFGPPLTLDPRQLHEIMLPNNHSISTTDPLVLLLSPNGNFYHFYHLPKRKRSVQYGEVVIVWWIYSNSILCKHLTMS